MTALPFANSAAAGASCSVDPGSGNSPSDPCGGEGYQGIGSCQPGSVGHVPKATPGVSNCVGSPPVGLYACPAYRIDDGVPGSLPVSLM